MQLRQYPLAFLATTLLLTITEQQGVAFTLTYQPGGSYTDFKQYQRSNGGQGVVQTSVPFIVSPIGTDNFLERLRTAFPASTGWTFNQATRDIAGNQVPFDLAGSFNISVYNADVKYRQIYLGFEPIAVGAQIQLHYTPGLGDPIPAINQLHWIQRVRSNHSYATNTHGNNEDVIDVPSGQSNPFYDLIPGIAYTDEENFADEPRRTDIENDHLWSAELFLVEVPDPIKPKAVTVYNGISWGWRNLYTPQPPQPTQTFSGTLTAGSNENQHQIKGLTPGNYFYAWTKNDLPSNQCNPNTYLTTYNNNSSWDDDDSSLVGDGFASALAGIVADDGTINLSVRASNPGGRGEDSGNYELYATVYDSNSAPPEIIVGSSGGGGVVFQRPRPGGTQQNPILPTSSSGGWQIFNNVPGCRWYDPHTTYGFEFQALENTLFTEILDFPMGQDNRFTVSVADNILGEFSPGDRLNFVSLFGAGVSNFRITDIDSLIGNTKETAFPIQLAFNNSVGSFQMRAIEETPSPKEIPEPTAIVGLFMLGGWGIFQWRKIQKDKEP